MTSFYWENNSTESLSSLTSLPTSPPPSYTSSHPPTFASSASTTSTRSSMINPPKFFTLMIENPAKLKKTPLPETIANWQTSLTPVFDMNENPETWPNSCPSITRSFTFQGRVTYSVDDRIKRAVLENSQKFGLRGHILMALYTLVFFSRREQDLFWKCVANFAWEMLPEEKHFVHLTGCTAQIEAGITQATGAPVKGAFVNGNAYFDVTCARGIQWYPYYEGRRIHDEIIQFGAQQRPSALF